MMSIRMSDVRRRRFQFRGVKLRKIATKCEGKGRFVTGKEEMRESDHLIHIASGKI